MICLNKYMHSLFHNFRNFSSKLQMNNHNDINRILCHHFRKLNHSANQVNQYFNKHRKIKLVRHSHLFNQHKINLVINRHLHDLLKINLLRLPHFLNHLNINLFRSLKSPNHHQINFLHLNHFSSQLLQQNLDLLQTIIMMIIQITKDLRKNLKLN